MKLSRGSRIPVVLFLSLFGYGAVAGAASKQGTRDTMAEAEAAKFCEDWDRSLQQGLASGPGRMLGQLIEQDSGTQKQRIRMRYSNAAIVDRVVILYIAECQYDWTRGIVASEAELDRSDIDADRRALVSGYLDVCRARLARSRERNGDLLVGIPLDEPGRRQGESDLDYRDQLGALAISTLSPRLYEYMWYPSSFGHGIAVEEYFAQVNAEETLLHLFDATLGRGPASAIPPVFDSVYRADGGGSLNAVRAMEYVHGIVAHRPDLGSQHHDGIVGFIERCHSLYWTLGDGDFNKKNRAHDYKLRRAMLQILAEVGTAGDISLAESLAGDVEPHEAAIGNNRSEHPADNPSISQLSSEAIAAITARSE